MFRELLESKLDVRSIYENTRSADLAKTKDEVEDIQDRIRKLVVTIKKEKDLGKNDNVMNKLHSEYKELQHKIAQTWKSYDDKHGTKYHKAYEAINERRSLMESAFAAMLLADPNKFHEEFLAFIQKDQEAKNLIKYCQSNKGRCKLDVGEDYIRFSNAEGECTITWIKPSRAKITYKSSQGSRSDTVNDLWRGFDKMIDMAWIGLVRGMKIHSLHLDTEL